MKWYGLLPVKLNSAPYLKNFHRRVRLKARTLAIDIRSTKSYKHFTTSIYLPHGCKYTYFKNKYFSNLIIINLMYETYYANVVFQLTDVTFLHSPLGRSLLITFNSPTNFFNLYWMAFNFVFNVLTQVFYHKLKFRGKGYYVYKNYRNVIAFQFGYAHRVKLYFYFLSVKFLSKTSVFLFGLNKWDIMKASNLFFSKRPINVFTGRGVRFTRQIIYRKAGKMSTYR